MSASCNRCGDCCSPVLLSPQRHAMMLWWSEQPDPATDDKLPPEVAELQRVMWLNGQWARHDLRMVDILRGATTDLIAFECRHFDKDSRLCTAHDQRPPVCSGFPWYDRPPLTAGLMPPSIRCSYWEDVAVEIRPKGWVKLSPEEISENESG